MATQTDPLATFPATIEHLMRYAKQTKPTKCRTCGLGDLVWYEDTTVTKPRARKWYLYDSSGALHDHPRAATTAFLVTLTYRVSAKTAEEARQRVEKWAQTTEVLDVEEV